MLSILSIGTNASPPPRQTQPTASDEPSKSTEGSSSSYAKQSASSVGTGTKETAAAERILSAFQSK